MKFDEIEFEKPTITEVEKLLTKHNLSFTKQKAPRRMIGNGCSTVAINSTCLVIYLCDFDYKLLKQEDLIFDDMVIEKYTNKNDRIRPHVVRCKRIGTLDILFRVLAKNPFSHQLP